MGLITTVVLLFLNLAASLAMAWWLNSILASLLLFVLLALGIAVYLNEQQASPMMWRMHVGYWSLSLANVMGLYVATKASGLLLVLLIINLIALLRAISRLDAQEAGIAWPVTEAGSVTQAGTASPAGASPSGTAQSSAQSHISSEASSQPSARSSISLPTLFPSTQPPSIHSPAKEDWPWPSPDLSGIPATGEPDIVLEDEPGVQVELETYKDGENAVPLIAKRGYSKQRSLKEFKALMKQVSRVSKGLSKTNKGSSRTKKAGKAGRKAGKPRR